MNKVINVGTLNQLRNLNTTPDLEHSNVAPWASLGSSSLLNMKYGSLIHCDYFLIDIVG